MDEVGLPEALRLHQLHLVAPDHPSLPIFKDCRELVALDSQILINQLL